VYAKLTNSCSLFNLNNLRPVSLFWAVPSLALGTVAVSTLGFVLRLIYPIVMGNGPPALAVHGHYWLDHCGTAVSTTASSITFAARLFIRLKGIWWSHRDTHWDCKVSVDAGHYGGPLD